MTTANDNQAQEPARDYRINGTVKKLTVKDKEDGSSVILFRLAREGKKDIYVNGDGKVAEFFKKNGFQEGSPIRCWGVFVPVKAKNRETGEAFTYNAMALKGVETPKSREQLAEMKNRRQARSQKSGEPAAPAETAPAEPRKAAVSKTDAAALAQADADIAALFGGKVY